MPFFVDNQNRTWQVRITTTEIKRLRETLGLNIVDGFDLRANEKRDVLAELADPVMLVDVLYVICQPQCEAADISDEQFGESLIGDVIDEATTALLEALCDFFPNKKRLILRALMAKVKARMDKAIPPSDDDLEKIVDAAMNRFGDSAGSSPELQDSTPMAAHSAS